MRAQQAGLPLAAVPLVLVLMNLVYAVSAYPFGKLSDGASHRRLLMLGLCVLIGADCALGLGDSWQALALGIALWGLHLGMTQGLLWDQISASAPFYAGALISLFTLALVALGRTPGAILFKG
jgi:MFS family permease